MPKLNTTVKAVRIDNEKLAELENRLGGQTINSWLNEKITEYLGGKPIKSDEKTGASPKYPYGIKGENIEELNSMAMFMGGTVGEMIRLFLEAVSDGTIAYQNGRYVGTPDLELDNFKEACHEMGVDAQKVLDKATQGVRRGTL